jgi:hypothetical protein
MITFMCLENVVRQQVVRAVQFELLAAAAGQVKAETQILSFCHLRKGQQRRCLTGQSS